MSIIEVFHFKEDSKNFEDLGQDNGFRYWYASDLAKCLGYDDYPAFRHGPVNRAMVACGTLSIPADENFIVEKRVVDGRDISEVRLSRFACYLVAMNGDVRKPQVAAAQAWFAATAESFRQYLEEARDVERLNIRTELSGKEKSLAGVAKGAGVFEYGLFHNAGYRGLYNMNLSELKRYKGLTDKGRSLLDFMGKEELAANFFRLTQTEAKIKNDGIRGQRPCEIVAENVGRTVRETMKKISGSTPENLPLEHDIKDTQKNLKKTQREFKKLDDKS
jgi:DNA-damage-inducible protein D